LAIVVLVTVGTYVYYETRPKEYTASTTVFVQVSELEQELFGSTASSVDPERDAENQAAFLQSRVIAEKVAKDVGLEVDPSTLLGNVKVIREEGADLMEISVTAGNPRQAAVLANGFARALIDMREEANRARVQAALQVAERELAQLEGDPLAKSARRALQDRIKRLRVIESFPASRVEQVDRALPPGSPSAPRPARNAVFAFFTAIVIAILAAFGLERLDRRMTNIDDVEDAFVLPVLAVVPEAEPATRDPNGLALLPAEQREAFRSLRTNLELQSLDEPLRTILVTSAVPGEGKSSVVRNLALAYEEAGRRVAVIEADLRRPTLSTAFGLDGRLGVTDVLAGRGTYSEALQLVSVSDPVAVAELTESDHVGTYANGNGAGVLGAGRLVVMTSGPQPPNPPAVLAANRAHEMVRRVAEEYDVVLLDSPPLLSVSDAMPLLSLVDAVLIVSRLQLTTKDAAKRLRDTLQRAPHANVVGVVANAVPASRDDYYAYGYE